MADTHTPHPNHDVRMRGFASRSTVDEALRWVDAQAGLLSSETVAVSAAHGRVLSEAVTSAVDVPGFPRAMMDGFALYAADTEGANAYNPRTLSVVGDALPGRPFVGRVERGQAVRIMTGAPMPDGADGVLPAEQTETREQIHESVEVLGAVAPEKHVGRCGEDIARGTIVLQQGRRLRPQDVGLLSSIGVADVPVVRRPRVRILVTGDELLPAGSTPKGFQITDANGPMLEALVTRDGGIPVHPGIVPDRPNAILDALRSDAEVILVSGGSSVGVEDFVPTLLGREGELAIHGIAMRPSSPTGMGCLEDRLVFLLPGNPVSCLCAYDFFAGRAIRRLGGRKPSWPYVSRNLPLTRKLVSVVGRLDYARVRVEDEGVAPMAVSGASILSSATRADGFVVIPEDYEGYPEGELVTVFLYDAP